MPLSNFGILYQQAYGCGISVLKTPFLYSIFYHEKLKIYIYFENRSLGGMS